MLVDYFYIYDTLRCNEYTSIIHIDVTFIANI